MIRHELYKILSRKSLWLVMGGCLALFIFFDPRSSGSNETLADPVYESLYADWGGAVTPDKVDAAREAMRASDAGDSSLSMEEGSVQYVVAVAGNSAAELVERKEALAQSLEREPTGTYAHRESKKELDMLNALENPYGFYLVNGWNSVFALIEPFFSVLLLAIMILLGVTPVFADEYTKRTAGLILATKHGRRKVVTAKVLASLMYTATIFSLFHVANFVLQLFIVGSFSGGDAPMQSLPSYLYAFSFDHLLAPYDWTIWQYFLVTMAVQLVACLCFTILVVFLSMLLKQTLFTFFLAGGLLAFPFLLRQFGMDEGFFAYLNSFSYLEFIRVERLFQAYEAYNLFGYPVLYPIMLVVIFTFISGFLIYGSFLYFRHHQVHR
ncbi:hypothetical protein JCM19046_848 [Bacillus sp. JCM 19046]|nr:hypothetical protein JCM19045_4042 [Bacillus sp. JCM 19045]GAF16413.1 hypothetical protein JCM19046_848 [Bacillus sp. JCM 19046]